MAICKQGLTLSALLLTSTLAAPAFAQGADQAVPATSPAPTTASPTPPPTEPHRGLQRKFSVMAGLTQWLLLRGGNLAVEYKTGRLALEASHGQGLDLNQLGGIALSSAERDMGTRVRVPWTTGFGVGYRVTDVKTLNHHVVHRRSF